MDRISNTNLHVNAFDSSIMSLEERETNLY
jgi:hypothetical protein